MLGTASEFAMWETYHPASQIRWIDATGQTLADNRLVEFVDGLKMTCLVLDGTGAAVAASILFANLLGPEIPANQTVVPAIIFLPPVVPSIGW